MKYSPTLILGLGPTGKTFLKHMQNALSLRSQMEPVEKVVLLWVGLQTPADSSTAAGDLNDAFPIEEIEISFGAAGSTAPDANSKTIREKYPWWVQARQPNTLTRADGRMAYYWDRQFNANPRWRENYVYIQRKLSGEQDSRFRLFVVASLSEIDSAMLPDFVSDLRYGVLRDRLSGVFAWLFLDGQTNERGGRPMHEEQKGNLRVATMRELTRFMSGKLQVMDHGEDRPSVIDQILLDHVFLFEKPGLIQPASDMMLMMLEETIARTIRNDIPAPVSSEHRHGFSISAANILTYLLPSAEVHRFCGSLLAREMLFSIPSREILPGGILPLTVRGSVPVPPVVKTDIEGDAARFLTETFEENGMLWPADPFSVLASAARGTWSLFDTGDLPMDVYTAFSDRLEMFMTREMNTPRDASRFDDSLKEQRIFNPLSWAAQFLKELSGTLNSAEYILLQQSMRGKTTARVLHDALPRMQKLCTQCRAQVERWQGEVLQRMYPRIEQAYQASLAGLQTSTQPSAGREVVLPNSRQELPAHGLYLENMRLPQGRRVVEELKHRWQWHWDRNSEGASELLFTLPDSSGKDSRFTFTSLREERFYQTWFGLAFQSTRSFIDGLTITNVITQTETPLNDRSLAPLLDVIPQPGPERVTKLYLTGSEGVFLERWSGQAGLMRTGQGIIISDDTTRITLLRLDYNLPSEAAKRLAKDQAQFKSSAMLYAQPAEQKAAQMEAEFQRRRRGRVETYPWNPLFPAGFSFSPDFVRLMFHPEMFDIAMQTVFFDALQNVQNFQGRRMWQITWPEPVTELPIPLEEADYLGDDLQAALVSILIHYPYRADNMAHPLHHNQYSATMRKLKEAFEAQSKAPSAALDKTLERIRQNMEQWEATGDPFYRDLALVQRHLYIGKREK